MRYTNSWLKHGAMVTIIGVVGLIGQSCSSNSEGTGINSGASGSTGNTGNIGNTGNTGTGGRAATAGGSGSFLGGSTGSGLTGSTSGGSTGAGLTGSTSGGARASGGSSSTPGAACQGLPFDDGAAGGVTACAGFAFEVEAVPVDMYIMMDTSISMTKAVEGANITRWEAQIGAVRDFVNHPDAQNVGAGIGFFPRLGYDEALDCDAGWYAANPKAPIGALSTNAPNIIAAMEAVIPNGLTPEAPALAGAVQYARNWATGHQGRATVVVLVTDGYPTMCEGGVLTLSNVLAAAKAGVDGSPPIRTYVIGLGGDQNLNNIARSGGTNQAYLVAFKDISTDLVNALLNITNSKVGCEFEIPDPTGTNVEFDRELVQFVYNPVAGATEEIPKLESASACDRNPNGGWFYDNPASPTKILVCPCTCSRLQAGEIKVNLGCKPKVGLR